MTSVSKTEWSNDDSNDCDDGDLCVDGEHCSDGECVTGDEPVVCDDGNPCTEEECEPDTGCVYTNVEGGCDDGNDCTEDDQCEQGECEGEVTDCNDGNPCTEDDCDPDSGCTYSDLGGDCDDGNECTIGDFCSGGECKPGGSELNCDDGNPCTDDQCTPQDGCASTDNSQPCDDGDPCTEGDFCKKGECQSGVGDVDCDDDNQCTADSCEAGAGCIHEPVDSGCSDGDPCTEGDACSNGVCVPGAAMNCDDGDPCTTDSCDSVQGCLYVPGAGPCDDGNECTENDVCSGGQCAGQVKDCDDDNICTVDSCNPFEPGGCVHSPSAFTCEDGNPCTLGDSCSNGVCMSGSGQLDCDDGNECTTDSCLPATGCKHQNKVGFCDDANPCTQGDYCANGECVSGAGVCACSNDADCVQFNDQDFCNGTLVCDQSSPNPANWGCEVDPATVVVCGQPQDTTCQKVECIPASGACEIVPINEQGSCDDNSVCTADDSCEGGFCVGIETVDCDDDNECTVDLCLAASGCQHSPIGDGASCGPAGWFCESGTCQPCQPHCGGKECGDNGCGGSCGQCGWGEVCNVQGQCVNFDCSACAPWQDCVGSACQNPASLGDCGTAGQAVSSDCGDLDWEGCCGELDNTLYYCANGPDCPWGVGECVCQLTCVGGYNCGWLEAEHFFDCQPGDPGPAPWGEWFCEWTCEPDCWGKECGDDGCEGSCGSCGAYEYCHNGSCVKQGLSQCLGNDTPSYNSCQGLSWEGCCDYQNHSLWCFQGKAYCMDCNSMSGTCGWWSQEDYYTCGTNGGSDPTGQHPKKCQVCIPPCPAGFQCQAGLCEEW